MIQHARQRQLLLEVGEVDERALADRPVGSATLSAQAAVTTFCAGSVRLVARGLVFR